MNKRLPHQKCHHGNKEQVHSMDNKEVGVREVFTSSEVVKEVVTGVEDIKVEDIKVEDNKAEDVKVEDITKEEDIIKEEDIEVATINKVK